jgi:2-phospho-L-lactate guanylyltransferase
MPAVDVAVLIPVKAFAQAKARLSAVLTSAQRVELAHWTADRVVAAAGDHPVFVACDDEAVAAWAGERGATVLWGAGLGLDAAVDSGIRSLADRGFRHAVVAHGDLARPEPLATVAREGVVTLVPDHRDDGTNVLSMPTSCGLRVSYGRGSFRRHLERAHATGLPVEVRRDALLALDIDTPDDLDHPMIRSLVREVLPEWPPTNPANHR